MVVVGGMMTGSHVVWVMMDVLAQRESVPGLVVFSVNTWKEKYVCIKREILIPEH